jgi:hypothetical protein
VKHRGRVWIYTLFLGVVIFVLLLFAHEKINFFLLSTCTRHCHLLRDWMVKNEVNENRDAIAKCYQIFWFAAKLCRFAVASSFYGY